MVAITDRTRPLLKKATPPTQEHAVDASVDAAVRRRLEACSYRFVFDKVTWHFEDGTLTLSGCVPSFYLKQVLQELFRNVEQVDSIANYVDVVSSNGISSGRPTQPH